MSFNSQYGEFYGERGTQGEGGIDSHSFRSVAGDLYTIEKDATGELSWDFSACENRIEALVAEIWRLREMTIYLADTKGEAK